MSGESVVTPVHAQESVQVELSEPGPTVLVKSAAGDPIPRASVTGMLWRIGDGRAGRSHHTFLAGCDANGMAAIPHFGGWDGVYLWSAADGFVTARQSARLPLVLEGGSFSIELAPAHDLRLRVVDRDDEPVRGARIELSAVTPTREKVEGWSRVSMTPSGTTDAEGRVMITRIEEGAYRADIEVHPSRRAFRGGIDLDAATSQVLHVPAAGETLVRIGGWRMLDLAVLDRESRAPVPGFQLTAPSLFTGAVVRSESYRWSGWIPVECSTVSVTAEGYGLVDVDLGAERPDSVLEVLLESGYRGRLRIEGEAAGLAGQRLTVRTAQEHPEGLWSTGVGSTEVVLGPDLTAEFHVPIRGRVIVVAEPIELGAETVRFEPRYADWTEGEVLVLQAVREPTRR